MTDMTPVSPLLSARALAQELQRDARLTVLDVRTPAEYAAEHIAQSFNIPLDQLAANAATLHELLQGPTVLVCRSGARASQAALILSEADIPQVHVLEGGLTSWTAAGLPVMRGHAPWPIERQVRGIAGGMVLLGALGGLFIWKPLTAVAALVGTGLTISAITDSCLMAQMLGKLPFNRAPTCSSEQLIAQLQAAR